MTVYITEYQKRTALSVRQPLACHETPLKCQEITDTATAKTSAEFDPKTELIDISAPNGRDIFVSFGQNQDLLNSAGSRYFIRRGTTQTYFLRQQMPRYISVKDVS